jgi:hypothetical protein
MSKKKTASAEDGRGEGQGPTLVKVFVNSEPWSGLNFTYRPGAHLRVGPEDQQGAEITEECAIAREAAGLGKLIEVPVEEPEDDPTDTE